MLERYLQINDGSDDASIYVFLGILNTLIPPALGGELRLALGSGGDEVRVAGLAICRQRPGTARGVMFVTLEDETGFSNFVVMPDVREALGDTLRAPLLLLEGVVENEQGVVNVLARRAERLDLNGDLGPSRSRDYR